MAKISADARIERLVKTIITHLELPVPVKLWNGTVVGSDSSFDIDRTMHVSLASSDAVRAIAKKPSINTLVELWSSRQLDIINGTVFDIAAIEKRTGLKARIKTLPKRAIAKDLPALWLSKSDHKIDTGLAGEGAHVSGSSQEAIEHHYDVSNAFYKLFLDEAMVYTCAYFKDWDNTLDQAQLDKLDHVCKKLRLKPGDRLLDIGCGWGGHAHSCGQALRCDGRWCVAIDRANDIGARAHRRRGIVGQDHNRDQILYRT